MRYVIFVIIILFSVVNFGYINRTFADYNPATGEDDLLLVSEEKEIQLGMLLAKSVEEKFGLADNIGMQKRVTDVGQKIADVCDRSELTYSFVVLEGKELDEDERYNAFALPGGYVYIFKEMVNFTSSDDELASVLAHEIGHIVARHSMKRLQESIGMAGLSLIGAIAQSDGATQRNTSLAITQLMMSYSRQAEFEADKLSIKYLEKAGFDSGAAVSFVDKMLEKNLKGAIRQYRYFRTHPYASERKAMLNKEIKGKFAFDDYINAPVDSRDSY